MLQNPAAGLIYGTIVVAALLDAESAARETYPATVGGVVIAVLLYWLAHAYADFTGHRLKRREAIEFREFGGSLITELTIVLGAAIPLAVLFLSWAAGASLDTAVNVGIYTSAAMVVVIELVAGLRARLAGAHLLLQVSFGAALGGLIIALKVVFH